MASTNWSMPIPLAVASGRLLIATPLLGDPHFARSIVYLLEHDDDGSVGVIVNRPSRTPVAHVLPAWQDVVCGPSVVFGGGPVQPDGALCLGRLAPDVDAVTDTRRVIDGVCTVDLDGDLDAITAGTSRLRVFAGHAGWTAGQLGEEIEQGAWWVVPGGSEDLFSDDPRPLWSRVLRRQPPPLSLLSTYPPDPLLN